MNEPESNIESSEKAVLSDDLLARFGRAQLGVDGNCGFALLGPDLQEGEAEFVEIQPGREPDNALTACKAAFRKLRERLNMPELNCYFGASHPYGG